MQLIAVTLTVNSKTFTSTVNADGTTFSVDVPGADLRDDADTTIDASVTTTTGHLNGEATATDTDICGDLALRRSIIL